MGTLQNTHVLLSRVSISLRALLRFLCRIILSGIPLHVLMLGFIFRSCHITAVRGLWMRAHALLFIWKVAQWIVCTDECETSCAYYNSIIKVLLLYLSGCSFAEQIRLNQQCLYFLAVDLGDLSLLTQKILVDLSVITWWEHQSIVIICLQLIMTRQTQVLYTVWWRFIHRSATILKPLIFCFVPMEMEINTTHPSPAALQIKKRKDTKKARGM